jgi:predicted metal-dependent hydrolase
MINTQLVGFEKKISDSVIVHELAHIKEHNHSTKF